MLPTRPQLAQEFTFKLCTLANGAKIRQKRQNINSASLEHAESLVTRGSGGAKGRTGGEQEKATEALLSPPAAYETLATRGVAGSPPCRRAQTANIAAPKQRHQNKTARTPRDGPGRDHGGPAGDK